MNRALITGALLAAAIAVTPFVRGDDIQGRPPGVASNDWVPITDRVGFVLIRSTKQVAPRQDAQVLLLRPTAPGYFMLKGASGWSRMVVVEPPRGPADAG
jgi:hypothetical protein